MDVVILSGGYGKRLREKIKDIPKTMALVNGKPLLEHTFEHIEQFDVKNIILAVGYKKEYIKKYFKNKFKDINIIYSEEEKPLGTGGAIKKALQYSKEEDVVIMNGDIYAKVNLVELMKDHIASKRPVTITLKEMENIDRFGIVEIDEQKAITAFKEKAFCKKGYVNVGIYVIKKNIFKELELNEDFSIERDFFSKYTDKIKHNAYLYNGEFIDIGIPKDYAKIQEILK